MQHIAILRQPFFNMVLSGEKTIESRWSIHKVAPYGKVGVGDEILLKETGKDVTATAKVKKKSEKNKAGFPMQNLTEKSLKCSENKKSEKEDEKNEILRCKKLSLFDTFLRIVCYNKNIVYRSEENGC